VNPFFEPSFTETGRPSPAPFEGGHADDDPVPSLGFRADSLLDIRGLMVSSGGSALFAVDAVTLSVSHGESLGLVGDSTAGLISIVLAVAGRLPAGAVIETGSIFLDGRELVGLGRRPAARLVGDAVGYLPADPLSDFDLARSVGTQLAGALRRRLGLTPDVARQRIIALLDRVGIADPATRARQRPQDLDPVAQHRVGLAAVLAGDPALVIAVSPGAGLAGEDRAAHLALLREVWYAGEFALLVATDDFDTVAASCDRVAVFEEGRIVDQGSIAEIRDARYGAKSARLAASIASSLSDVT
jgi:peptide/nickel transport system ATP-binding protein